jgi:predicted DNA repair protein MutK
VKADDVGLHLASRESVVAQKIGSAIVRGMPYFMKALVIIGTAAMIWVGGSIIVHALKEMGVDGPYNVIHDIAVSVAHAVPSIEGFLEWFVTAFIDGLIGLALGFLLIPVVLYVINPVVGMFSRGEKA